MLTTVVRGPNRVRTANSATATVTAAADTRCAQAKRDRSNSSPPPPSQWSPWSRVLQRTPLSCPTGRRNGSSHATLSSAVDSFPRWRFRKIRGTARRGIHVPPTAMDAKVTRWLSCIIFSSHLKWLAVSSSIIIYTRIGIDMYIDFKILLALSPSGGVRFPHEGGACGVHSVYGDKWRYIMYFHRWNFEGGWNYNVPSTPL